MAIVVPHHKIKPMTVCDVVGAMSASTKVHDCAPTTVFVPVTLTSVIRCPHVALRSVIRGVNRQEGAEVGASRGEEHAVGVKTTVTLHKTSVQPL